MAATRTKTINPIRKNKLKLYSFTLLALTMLTMSACGSDGVFVSDFQAVSSDGWTKSQPLLFFPPDSVDGINSFDIAVNVRHDNFYQYRNLWLIVDYSKAGKILEHDTVNIQLADKYGDWGGSGLGKMFQKSMTIKDNVRSGQYDKITIWHNMKCDKVENISDIGLTYRKTK